MVDITPSLKKRERLGELYENLWNYKIIRLT